MVQMSVLLARSSSWLIRTVKPRHMRTQSLTSRCLSQ